MAIARHLIVEGSRSNVSMVSRIMPSSGPVFVMLLPRFGFGSVWRKAISLTPLIYPI